MPARREAGRGVPRASAHAPPYLPEGADYDLSEFWARHDPDDWRQWDDVPKELADCEWRRAAGVWRPFRAETATCPVLSIDRQKREHDRTLRQTH